ncbi:MAG: SDR family oxidoreductase, partial [Pseudomonadales bacterium]|nr:SDR family oxidoreductase [Pseudomonadales bacterium]
EVAADGVRVAVVAPGLIDNGHLPDSQKQWMAERVPSGRLGRPEEVADAVCFLCSDLATYCSGTVLTVAGGWRWSEDRSYHADALMRGGEG